MFIFPVSNSLRAAWATELNWSTFVLSWFSTRLIRSSSLSSCASLKFSNGRSLISNVGPGSFWTAFCRKIFLWNQFGSL